MSTTRHRISAHDCERRPNADWRMLTANGNDNNAFRKDADSHANDTGNFGGNCGRNCRSNAKRVLSRAETGEKGRSTRGIPNGPGQTPKISLAPSWREVKGGAAPLRGAGQRPGPNFSGRCKGRVSLIRDKARAQRSAAGGVRLRGRPEARPPKERGAGPGRA